MPDLRAALSGRGPTSDMFDHSQHATAIHPDFLFFHSIDLRTFVIRSPSHSRPRIYGEKKVRRAGTEQESWMYLLWMPLIKATRNGSGLEGLRLKQAGRPCVALVSTISSFAGQSELRNLELYTNEG
jgi:hypothetical protein